MRTIDIDEAALPVRFQLRLAGTTCRVATNSDVVGESLHKWRDGGAEVSESGFRLQVMVRPQTGTDLSRPHFRGMGHLVFGSFGPANRFIFDLERRTVVATVSEDAARDPPFWDRLLLPIALGVLGAAMGVVPVHSACLSVDGDGLLIAGGSGAGKSTLSVALAKNGFDYLSDDWTYVSLDEGRLVAHGMSAPAKLLPDAADYFPELCAYPVAMALNEELAYELPAADLGANVKLSCRARWFFFLERSMEEGCRLTRVSADESMRYVERSVERLPVELAHIAEARAAIVRQVSRLSCWKLVYGGSPEVAVRGLGEFVARQREAVTV